MFHFFREFNMFSRRGSTPASNVLRKSVRFFITNIFLITKNTFQSEIWPLSCLNDSETQERGLSGVKIQKLLVFSVTTFKIDQNKNQNCSIDKVQNLGNERRYIYKDPRQDSGQRNISYTRYPKKCFTQTYRDLYGDAMLVLTWMSSNMADGNQQKHLLPSFATKA